MKVNVKLYGTLTRNFPGYRHLHGIDIEVPDGAVVKDLLAYLEIPESTRVVVIMEGRVRSTEEKVRSGTIVNIMQLIGGG